MIRVRKAPLLLKDLMRRLSLELEISNILLFFIYLLFTINIIGSLLIIASTFDINNNEGWIQSAGLIDSGNPMIYISGIYFSTEICTTVGYGDLLP